MGIVEHEPDPCTADVGCEYRRCDIEYPEGSCYHSWLCTYDDRVERIVRYPDHREVVVLERACGEVEAE